MSEPNQIHTPTPWALRDCEIVSTVKYLIEPNADEDEQGIPITVINLTGAMGGNDGDAAFIVKACNAYEALVAAIRSELEVCSYCWDADHSPRRQECPDAQHRQFRAALENK